MRHCSNNLVMRNRNGYTASRSRKTDATRMLLKSRSNDITTTISPPPLPLVLEMQEVVQALLGGMGINTSAGPPPDEPTSTPAAAAKEEPMEVEEPKVNSYTSLHVVRE